MNTADIGSQATEAASAIGGTLVEEIKKFGESFLSQAFGSGQKIPSEDELKKMTKNDDTFKKQPEAEVQAKIRAIYEEHQARLRKRKLEEEEEKKQEEEARKVAELNQLRVQKQELANVAIAKTRAEIKNYGAE